MNSIEQEMTQILTELKDEFCIIGLKSEFEAEGATIEETQRLKNIANQFDLELTIKIAGCEAIRDLEDVKKIGADNIVAPMIESPYALEKFVNAAKSIFQEKAPNLFINIETITGYKNLESILFDHEASYLAGVVLGRSDMCGSMGLYANEVNSDKMLFFSQQIAQKTEQFGKDLTIGGRVNADSFDFFKQIKANSFKKIETRKIIFDIQKLFIKDKFENAIKKALQFELLWLENKSNYNKEPQKSDLNRITTLSSLL